MTQQQQLSQGKPLQRFSSLQVLRGTFMEELEDPIPFARRTEELVVVVVVVVVVVKIVLFSVV